MDALACRLIQGGSLVFRERPDSFQSTNFLRKPCNATNSFIKLEENLALPAENLMALEATMFRGGTNKEETTRDSKRGDCCLVSVVLILGGVGLAT